MNNKKYKTTMGAIAGLMVLSGGMFAYENVYVAKQAEANKVNIFVAKQDIQAHTVVKPDMFMSIPIDNTSVLQGYVLDLNSVTGKTLKGGILQGEPLTKQRLADKDNTNFGQFMLQIAPDLIGDVVANDNVRIYVQLISEESGEVVVKELFENKKVIGQESGEQSLLGGGQNKDTSFNVIATEKEVKDYFIAKQTGSILVVKLNGVDTDKITSEDVGKFDADSEEVKTATKDRGQNAEGQAIQTYTIKESDSLESLSMKFKTKKETISALNNGKDTFEVGEMIQVPAN